MNLTDDTMKIARGASFDGLLYDITKPNGPVSVEVSVDKTVLWVNVGATCVLRICRVSLLELVRPEHDVYWNPDLSAHNPDLS